MRLTGQITTEVVKKAQSPVSAVNQRVSATVLRVVDGDTFVVLINGKKETVRIIGINSPEIVDPRRPVECFGKEAADEAKRLLNSQTVQLQNDPTQSDKDKYNRLLRYISFGPDQKDFGLEMIRGGFAYEYTFIVPYQRQTAYKEEQKKAQEIKSGLWGDHICSPA
jgi:micrococcal nuclease